MQCCQDPDRSGYSAARCSELDTSQSRGPDHVTTSTRLTPSMILQLSDSSFEESRQDSRSVPSKAHAEVIRIERLSSCATSDARLTMSSWCGSANPPSKRALGHIEAVCGSTMPVRVRGGKLHASFSANWPPPKSPGSFEDPEPIAG